LVRRANRGLFVINELPDLAGKVQVGLFNIMQEGDVQIKRAIRCACRWNVMLVFTANPEDYTARGKSSRLERPHRSEIRTHYPMALSQGMAITRTRSLDEAAFAGGIRSASVHP